MDAAAASTDALSVIGFFLTLVSLLGSFFYIHLSDWLREVIAMETKWDINKDGQQVERIAARRECRYEIGHVAIPTTVLTSLVVTGFVIFIFVLGANLWWAQQETSAAWTYIGLAGVGFMGIYLGMTIFLLGLGCFKARRLHNAVLKFFADHPNG